MNDTTTYMRLDERVVSRHIFRRTARRAERQLERRHDLSNRKFRVVKSRRAPYRWLVVSRTDG